MEKLCLECVPGGETLLGGIRGYGVSCHFSKDGVQVNESTCQNEKKDTNFSMSSHNYLYLIDLYRNTVQIIKYLLPTAIWSEEADSSIFALKAS